MSFFTTVEFYIILAITAAAIVAFASRPDNVKPVAEHLLAGSLADDVNPAEAVELHCDDSGKVRLTRHGISGLCENGAASLAIKVKGCDVAIEERLTPGRGIIIPEQKADFALDFLAPGLQYHISYNSEKTGLFAAFPFTVKPGISAVRPLSR